MAVRRTPAARIPVVTAESLAARALPRGDLDELARAEQAMADGRPTADQELLLMSVGSVAHLARRHRSIAVRQCDGVLTRWLRRWRRVR
jgi:hypothetical protein